MRRFTRITRLASASILGFSTLLTLGLTGVAHALTPLYWCGVQTTGTFNIAGNWNTNSNCSGGTARMPQTGDDLVFDTSNIAGLGTVTLTNDMSGLSVDSITFTGASSSDKYILTGNALTITGGITQSGASTPILGTPLTISGNQAITVGSELNVTGALSGSGNINLVASGGSGELDVASSSNYTGVLTATSGTILSLVSTASPFAFGGITVANGASIALENDTSGPVQYNFPLTVGGPGTSGGQAAIYLAGNTALTDQLLGSTTLTADTTVDGNGTLEIDGPLSGAFAIATASGATNATLTVASSNNTSNTPNDATFNGGIGAGADDGGDDVTAPNTGFALAAAHPMATLAITLASAATIFAVARSTRKATSRR